MLFGTRGSFGVEVGGEEEQPEFRDVYVRARFWVGGVAVGDWEELISLSASIRSAGETCGLEGERRRLAYGPCSAGDLFREVYEAVFSLHCFVGRSGGTDLRALYHLDAIGMGSLRNKFGLILVATDDGLERVIAKDLNSGELVADVCLPGGSAVGVLGEYAAWGKARLERMR